MNVFQILFSGSTFGATLRMAVPLLYTALGGALAKMAGIEDIGLEGLMLIGCFSGFAANYLTSSWVIGILAAVLFTVLFSMLFGLFVVTIHANEIVTGVALNVMGTGLTTYVMRVMFGVKGSFTDPRVRQIPDVDLGAVKKIPFIGDIIGEQSILFWLSLAVVLLLIYLIYHTRLGSYIQACGANAKALASAGVNVSRVRYVTLLIHGVLIGIGGVYLSTGYLTQYVEDMSAGRGFIAMAAYAFGFALPGRTFWAVMLFAFVQALSSRLQLMNVPSYFSDMIPYIITIIVLVITSYRSLRREKVTA